MRIGLMIEGQADLTWERWIHILQTAERLNFPSVFRSGHYFIGKHQNSIDLFLSFMIAARETKNIRFGSLVSPMTFRSPVDVGRMTAQINQLSNGRLILGLGAGWHRPEHDAYGIPFYTEPVRAERLEEAINVLKTLWGPGPASFEGKHFTVKDVDCLPKPVWGADTPIIVGGSGEKRTLGIVAKYADEWNCVNMQPETYRHKLNVLTERCTDIGRDISTMHQSMMAFGLVADDERTLDRLTRFVMDMHGATGSPAAYRQTRAEESNWIVGLTSEVVDKLGAFGEMGLEEVQFQHFNFASDEVPKFLASEIAPRVAGL